MYPSDMRIIRKKVLNHIDLKVNAGDYMALVGPSGVGKDHAVQPDSEILRK